MRKIYLTSSFDRCVCCGAPLPEGRMVCLNCERSETKAEALHEREETYMEALELYGFTTQAVVAIEELSEAQKEICKTLRGKGNLDHLAEEIADAAICLEQMCRIFNIKAEVREKMDEKVDRLRQNMARDKAKKKE